MPSKRQLMGSGLASGAANAVAGIAATPSGVGTAQAGATLLSADLNVLTAASGQTAFVLPTSAQGSQRSDSIDCYNPSSTTALVYPGGADTANGSTSAISVAQNKLLQLRRTDSTSWGYFITA